MSRNLVALLALAFVFHLLLSACSLDTPDCVGVVSWVVDGDTIYVDSCSDVSIRFLDVNAPELDTPAGVEAKWELIDRMYGEVVELYCDGYGYYGRWLCVVEVR
jgi:endonuclease YncB( thermonuclease family)